MKTVYQFMLPLLFMLLACSGSRQVQNRLTAFVPSQAYISGRAIKNSDGSVSLASSAASCCFTFEGEHCLVYIKNAAPEGEYNYVTIEVDDEYGGRYKVSGKTAAIIMVKAKKTAARHKASISKATEAANGQVIITGIEGKSIALPMQAWKGKIECIGNSITCGFGNDLEIPCGNGSKWYDQHNAYWSYASVVARANKLELMISAISGAGIYRHWNREAPTVPGQYENVFLDGDSSQKWNFNSYIPDIVTIALGTNDISDGDGKSARSAFDKATYILAYKQFISRIYANYGKQVQLVLLNSPMVGGAKGQQLEEAVLAVKEEVNREMKPLKPVQIFFFRPVSPTGCTYHPSAGEHGMMGEQLSPFIKKLL